MTSLETIPYARLRDQPRLDLAATFPLPAPLTVYVETTNVCNLRCPECPTSLPEFKDRQGGWAHMEIADWETFADQMEEFGQPAKQMHFYMLGEPLINPNVTWMIAEAKRRNLAERTILTTNGTLLGHHNGQRLLDSGLDYLRVSVYEGQVDRVKKNVEHFVQMRQYDKPHVYVKSFVRSGIDVDSLFWFVDEKAQEPLMDWNGATDEPLGDRPGDHGARHGHPKKACPSPFYTMVVHANLDVSPCCVDWDKSLVLGNLRRKTLKQIWESDKLTSLRRSHVIGDRYSVSGCSRCSYLHTLPDDVDSLTVEDFDARAARG